MPWNHTGDGSTRTWRICSTPRENDIDFGGQRVISQDPNAVGMAYLFALERPLSEYRFVYETPSLIVRQPIAYELKDIDLP